MNGPLQYSLTAMAQSDFEDALALTRSLPGARVNTTVRHVTDDIDRLNPWDQDFVLSNSPNIEGLCARPKYNNFDIWISPDIPGLSHYFSVVLLHELSHVSYTMHHDKEFKNFLGRALYHYGDIVSPIPDVDKHVLFMLDRYSTKRRNESYSEYSIRLKRVREQIRNQAEEEYDTVRERFERER